MDVASIQAELHRYYDKLIAGVCLIGMDESEPILFVNRGLLDMYHCGDEGEFYRLTGKVRKGMIEAADYRPLDKADDAGRPKFITFRFRTADGRLQRAEGAARIIHLDDGTPVWLAQFVSYEMRRDLSGTDYLTGALSTHGFFEQVSRRVYLESAQGHLSDYCPTYFNLTNFRIYNALHGMAAGDCCLKQIAITLRQHFPTALMARMSADGFAVLAPREDLFPNIEIICGKINTYIHNPNIRLKAGICLLKEGEGRQVRHAFDMAKVACDTIKMDATRCWAVYSRDMGETLAKRAFVLENFDNAMEQGYIKVYYQPVVRAMTGKICGLEALARWDDPVYGQLSPGIFIPVLERAQLIHKLDSYIIRRVGKHMHYRLVNQEPALPVSFNLSRHDFNLMDPFSVVEDVVHHYDIPREYFRIEVTESALAREKHNLVRVLGQFQDAGYQVWLDDFGSEYSSLNVLHNYHFDELKIDMAFLRNFNDQSRKILTSIVLMAKTLGVHTLAEGAETKEQVEFLKEIGCEKIQGYYFGKPMKYDDIKAFCQDYPAGLETRLEEHVYDKAGLINVVTDSPVGIFRYDGQQTKFLLKNKIYDDSLRAVHSWKFTDSRWDEMVPDPSAQQRFKNFLDKAIASKREQVTTYVENGQYIRLFVEIIGGTAGFYVGRARIYNITYDQDTYNLQRVDALLRNVLLMYDGLYCLNSATDTIEIIKTNHPYANEGDTLKGIAGLLRNYASQFVHEDDRKRFLEFMKLPSLRQRVQKSTRPAAGSVFRVKQRDGSYCWTVFMAIILSGLGNHDYNILLCVCEDVWESEDRRRELLPVVAESFGLEYVGQHESAYYAWFQDLCQAMIRHSGIKFFWKDLSRRFVGVSQAFLDYYEIRNVADIVGKTDEDMGWHINYHHFKDEERAVLEHGAIFRDVVGQCIVRGRPHHIMATKFPVYRGKKIIGLIGYFYDLDKIDSQQKQIEELSIIDKETQLLNFRGLLLVAMQYANNYRIFSDDYTCVLLDVPEIDRIRRDYGPDVAQELLHRVTEEIVRMNPLKETIAHLGNCRFMYLKSGSEDQGFREQMMSLANAIHHIKDVQGYRCTLYLQYAMAKGSEGRNFDDILKLLSARLSEAQQQQYGKQAYIGDRLIFDREKFDHLQEQVAIIDPQTYDILYANPYLCQAQNLADASAWMGEKCYHLLMGRDTPCEGCNNEKLRRDRFHMHLYHDRKLGRDLLMMSTLIPWQERNYRFTIAYDMTKYIDRDVNDNIAVFREAMVNDVIAVGMREANPATGLQKMMALTGQRLAADRILIFEESGDGTVRVSYEWHKPGLKAVRQRLQSIPLKTLRPLYTAFNMNGVSMIDDFPAFCQEHPDFLVAVPNLQRMVSGHLMLFDKSMGFTAVINPDDTTFKAAGLFLSTLTLFVTIMLRNRDTLRTLETLGRTDQLTNIGNRRGFLEYVRSLPAGIQTAFIFGDLNGLKRVNDTQGHEAGDQLICKAAQIMVDMTKEGRAFRMGGDEFLLIVAGRNEKQAAQIVKNLRERYQENGMSMALGYSVQTTPIENIDAVISEVDRKMYDNKGVMYGRRRTDRKPVRE